MNSGCILLARNMLDSDLMKQSPLVIKLWVWLLLRALWKDGNKLKRGQLVTTIHEMREVMSHYSGWRKTTPSPDQIRSAYGVLKDTARITVMRTTRGVVITICNYDAYQDINNYGSRKESHDGLTTHPSGIPSDRLIKEEGKKDTFAESDLFSKTFDWFWKQYATSEGRGRQGNKISARKHLQKSIRSEDDALRFCFALENYLDQVDTENEHKTPDNSRQLKLPEVFANQWTGYVPDDADRRISERKRVNQ